MEKVPDEAPDEQEQEPEDDEAATETEPESVTLEIQSGAHGQEVRI